MARRWSARADQKSEGSRCSAASDSRSSGSTRALSSPSARCTAASTWSAIASSRSRPKLRAITTARGFADDHVIRGQHDEAEPESIQIAGGAEVRERARDPFHRSRISRLPPAHALVGKRISLTTLITDGAKERCAFLQPPYRRTRVSLQRRKHGTAKQQFGARVTHPFR